MINVTVINLKSVIKYLLVILVLMFIFGLVKVTGKNIKVNEQIFEVNLISCISETLPEIDNGNIKKIEEIATTSKVSGLKRMLGVELPMIDKLIIDGEENEEIVVENEEKIEMAETNVKTQEVEENNFTPTFNGTFGTVKVKNESKKEITEEILTPNITLENNKDVIIFHTHTCESYTASENFNYEMTGSYRTTDLNYSVARVGSELKKYLTEYGYNVTHDQTYHDYPAYSGSYGRSLTTVKNILEKNSDSQLIIDLHRDAVR